MHSILQDVRFAIRQFLKRPVWTLVIVVVLALSIGANTAMFTGFDAWVLRPFDFHAPERLVALRESQPAYSRLWRPTGHVLLTTSRSGRTRQATNTHAGDTLVRIWSLPTCPLDHTGSN